MNDRWTEIHIEGVVQGVGFRPTVYRIATTIGLEGTVENAVDGVHIRLKNVTEEICDRLVGQVKEELPPIARIDRINRRHVDAPRNHTPGRFAIVSSDDSESRPTDVSPDCAICSDCLADIDRQPRRRMYALTNCTNCGPRYSIVETLPYDRAATSMSSFRMCDGCRREYTDPLDRRFHAQPVSCLDCGPDYSATTPAGIRLTDMDTIIDSTASELSAGRAVVLKGVGGYNIIADASSAAAVDFLRDLKRRPRKPFAIMVAGAAEAARYVVVGEKEAAELKSWRAPIVLCRRRTDSGGTLLPETVAPSTATLGVMLPYMGFHHLLFRRTGPMPLIVTSANFHGLPIITDDSEAQRYAADNGLMWIGYNRRIVNRQDDSVVRFADTERILMRRSRGFVPEPLGIPEPTDGIIAAGADITSQWALGRDHDIVQSPYIGSLTSVESEEALKESMRSMTRLFRAGKVSVVAVDAHPAYISSQIGRELAARHGARVEEVFHHHAHAVSVMADYGLTGPVAALVLDGTGYGPDGRIHGSELLECTLTDFTTLRSGPFFAMPGGDKASLEPWRMAVSVLNECFGDNARLPGQFLAHVGARNAAIVARMVSRRINSPMSCGAGRLWDAVAALLGIAYENSYEAEAPILLEGLAAEAGEVDSYPLDESDPLSPITLFSAITDDIEAGTDRAVIAARFHASYAEAWCRVIAAELPARGLDRIVASGGVMQNALLVALLRRGLARHGIELLLPKRVTCNDACIAVGQMACAAARIAAGTK